MFSLQFLTQATHFTDVEKKKSALIKDRPTGSSKRKKKLASYKGNTFRSVVSAASPLEMRHASTTYLLAAIDSANSTLITHPHRPMSSAQSTKVSRPCCLFELDVSTNYCKPGSTRPLHPCRYQCRAAFLFCLDSFHHCTSFWPMHE